jgi:hypothetical protein
MNPCDNGCLSPAVRNGLCHDCLADARRDRFQLDDDPDCYEDATDYELGLAESDWENERLR